MDLTTLRSKSRKYTHTDETNYTNTELDADINIAYGEVWMMILEAQGYENISGGFKVTDLISTSGLTAGEIGYNGEYPFPSDAFDIVRAEFSYDGDKWYPAEIVRKTDSTASEFNEDQITGAQDSPRIWVFRDSYFVRPLKTSTGDITGGIKLMVKGSQTALSLAADEPQFNSNFHNLIPLKVAQDFYLTYPDKTNPRIDRKIAELEAQLISFYQSNIKYVPTFRTIKEKF